MDDPSGEICGERIRCGSARNYEDRHEDHHDGDERLWAELMQALKPDAKVLVMSVPAKGRGKMVLAVLKKGYPGSSSAAGLCQRGTAFVNSSKGSGVSIQEHNTRWGAGERS